MSEGPDIFKLLNNALIDLQASDFQSYELPLKTFGKLLSSEVLTEHNSQLTKDVDLDAFLTASQATQGGMIGSARLLWPDDPKQVMGLTILLVARFAAETDFILNFGHTFYHSDNRYISSVHAIVRQRLIPFVRDYKDYVLSKGNMTPRVVPTISKKVFVVHGHDREARETVARFLERIGYEPVILDEQANQGRTIIEKVEANSDVGFAVVLLTADDEGCVKGGQPEPRARQNVLLELGYFMGCIGRNRVCALKKGSVDIPSDFAGIVWEAMDPAGSWKASLGRELQAAGYAIDWNKVMS